MRTGSRGTAAPRPQLPVAYVVFAWCNVLASAALPVHSTSRLGPDADLWGAALDVEHAQERGTSPAAPTLPTGYSAYILQQHYDGVSKATRARYFAMYHDFPLKMQRLDHSADAFVANASNARAEKLIQRYGRSWGDRCGGSRLVSRDKMSRSSAPRGFYSVIIYQNTSKPPKFSKQKLEEGVE